MNAINTAATLTAQTKEHPWQLARRTDKMNPSVIREILKVTERPGIISLAGGLPAVQTFDVEAFDAACHHVLTNEGLAFAQASLQYAASEGYGPLRERVAAFLPWDVDPAQVLITTGSQQGLDLVAKVLLDEGSTVAVETPTYLGALQAFTPMEPRFVGIASDEQGLSPSDLAEKGRDARFLYVLPNFQNPTGRMLSEERRVELVNTAQKIGLPIVEDNPYGELWFDQPPPLPLTARLPAQSIYLGSFSKVLSPGMRMGFLVAPPAVFPKLLQAKQASDLHSPGFNQRVIEQVMKGDFLDRHIPKIRQLYHHQRDVMLAALAQYMPAGVRWNTPLGGMFLWVNLPAVNGKPMRAVDLLPVAVNHGVAFVPGAPFYSGEADHSTLRLSFVSATQDQIKRGVEMLANAISEHAATLV